MYVFVRDKTMAALDSCSALLPNLDPDILSYIAGIIEDDSDSLNAEETADTISGLLISSEYCETEEHATALASKLLSLLGTPKSPATAVQGKSAGPISKPQAPLETKIGVDSGVDDIKESSQAEKRTAARDAKKANRKGLKSGKMTKSEQVAAQALELDAELHAARVAAVKARTKLGCYKGALDAKQFTLPNPGGGIPLLEDAACTLQPGRKYGLIGRNGTGKS
jgi:ATP-binding cassette, subfamily F, member 3